MRRHEVLRCALTAFVLLLLSREALAQTLELHLPRTVGDPRTAQVMRDLAERIIPIYQEPDRQQYLATLSALQEVAGSWPAAYAARLSLAELTHRLPAAAGRTPQSVYELHVRARALQAEDHVPYGDGLARSFETLAGSLDDLAAYRLGRWLNASPAPQEAALQRSFDALYGQERISLAGALDLIQAYAAFDAQRGVAPLAPALVAGDEARRYNIDELHIPVAAGASVGALLVRPRGATRPLPSILTLTLGPLPAPGGHTRDQAIASAAHGYIGVAASARTWRAPAPGVRWNEPFVHEGEDARAVIRWLGAQGGSDGQVAMMGQGYGAFAAWAAARHPPPALRALVVASATAPGIDLPMEGGIFRSEAFRWLLYVSRAPGVSDEAYRDEARWRDLDARWFASGLPYRDLDRLYGVQSPVFQRWLAHPSLDAFWLARLPSAHELRSLAIPVLSLTGYYDAGGAGALHYFRQHRHARTRAEHLLLAGPYDQEALAAGPPAELAGYPLDPAARIDLSELRYQWLDHVLRGAPRPALLSGTVNYEVMGADAWRHVDRLPAAPGGLTLYLAAGSSGGPPQLLPSRPAAHSYVEQQADLAAREAVPVERAPILAGSLRWRDAQLFVSSPLLQSVELGGSPVLRLLLTCSARDVDLTATLYEQLPDGRYLMLHAPPYEQRASYARDPGLRHLLTPGHLTPLTLSSPRLVAVRTQPGSRLALLLGVKKRPDEEVNHGSGGDVSRESRASARRPVTLRWYSGSRITIPVGP
jgi:putative CocE/NonD family hydrolase